MTCPHCHRGLRPPTEAELVDIERIMAAYDKRRPKRAEPLTVMERLERAAKL